MIVTWWRTALFELQKNNNFQQPSRLLNSSAKNFWIRRYLWLQMALLSLYVIHCAKKMSKPRSLIFKSNLWFSTYSNIKKQEFDAIRQSKYSDINKQKSNQAGVQSQRNGHCTGWWRLAAKSGCRPVPVVLFANRTKHLGHDPSFFSVKHQKQLLWTFF